MVQFSPDCRTPSLGYTYTDRRIEGFSLTHMSGVGCNDYGQVFLTATTGAISANPTDYASSFSHRHETVSPGYYQVMLQKFDVNAELTATLHTGVVRFTYPPNQPANILLPISHVLTTATHAKVEIVGDNEIDGEVTSHAFCNKQGLITVYFAMTVDHPFTSFGTWTGSAVAANSRSAEQVDRTSPGIGAYVSYPHGLSQAVTARIGISFVDVDGARNNLKSEAAGRGFDALSQTALQSWKNELGAISIDRGGDTAQRVKFYTALYHSLLMPNVFSDADGRYIGFDDKPHTVAAGHTEYANFSGWDIYRTQIPLLALIEPQRLQDMCQSIVDIYRYGGWIDRWPQANTYTNDMVGSPLTIIMATAWNDGLHHFDIETAYKGMVTDATQPAPAGAPYLGEVDVQSMNKLGYIPEHGERYGSVSQTEEDCVAYASLADLASSLGKTNDADVFRARAMNYRNNFDPATKFMRPRLASGAWATPFTPTERMGYVEGSAWEYRWLVPFDVAGLIQLLGGEDSFNAELDTFFGNTPTSARSYYDATNEPDIQAPFLYDYSGQPWKTQQRVRELLEDAYKTTPNGIAGNDDCGTMSSWFVLAALGIYTVDPATSIFELTSPLFAKATIHTQTSAGKNAEFVINAPNNSEADQYVQSVALNRLSQTVARSRSTSAQRQTRHGAQRRR
jgi:predicted alpha-1,2-mannosidase